MTLSTSGSWPGKRRSASNLVGLVRSRPFQRNLVSTIEIRAFAVVELDAVAFLVALLPRRRAFVGSSKHRLIEHEASLPLGRHIQILDAVA